MREILLVFYNCLQKIALVFILTKCRSLRIYVPYQLLFNYNEHMEIKIFKIHPI